MYVYMYEKSSGKTHLHDSITNMELLKKFNMINLGDELRLSDNDFDAWLEDIVCVVEDIESVWSSYKRKFCHQAGNNTDTYRTYFPEFLWQKRFCDISHVFYNFWYHVSLFYPVEQK